MVPSEYRIRSTINSLGGNYYNLFYDKDYHFLQIPNNLYDTLCKILCPLWKYSSC